MKKILWVTVLALSLLTGKTLMAAGAFEGEVDYQMTAKEMTGTMDCLIKGQKVRINSEMKGHSSAMIMDSAARQTIMLMPEQKAYMVYPFPKPKSDSGKPKGSFSKTGKTQEILGHTCEEWLYRGEKDQVSTWCASGLGSFTGMFQNGKSLNRNEWVEAIKHKGLFPLKTEMRDGDGNVKMTMEATKIDKRSVSASEFEVPSDYKKFNMPDFGDMGGSGKKPSKEDIMKMMEQYKK